MSNNQPSVNFEIPGDVLTNLPTDQTVPSHNEIQILDTLFKQKQGNIKHILHHSKDVLIVGILFLAVSLPQVDKLLIKFIPSTEKSPYILLLVKSIMMMVLYFVAKNWYLGRN